MKDIDKPIDMYEAGMLNEQGKDALIDALMDEKDES